MIGWLKRRREAWLDASPGMEDWRQRLFSGASLALWRAGREQLQWVGGRLLDAGAGRGAWRAVLQSRVAEYESIDTAPRGGRDPTWCGDVCAMPAVPGSRYDTVVCHQVLEHVADPDAALAEFRRVLRPGGRLLLTVPHLNRRHELPHDYWRFTPEGLALLLRRHGYCDVEVRPYGGLLCFLHHQFSCVVVAIAAVIPLAGTAVALLNAPLSWLACVLDGVTDRAGLLALGVAASARSSE